MGTRSHSLKCNRGNATLQFDKVGFMNDAEASVSGNSECCANKAGQLSAFGTSVPMTSNHTFALQVSKTQMQ
jgi:hypothetical protein